MSEETQQTRSLVPHMALGALVVAVLLLIFFWPGKEETPKTVAVPEPVSQPSEPVSEAGEPLDNEPEIIVDVTEVAEPVEPPVIEEPKPEPEPLDASDSAVKTSLLSLANYELAASLLVNEDLLQRFVVLTSNMANKDTAPNHQVLNPPTQSFRVYQQAGKEWIDAASYKRYTPYVDTFDAMETGALISLYNKYKPAIDDIYAEVGDPDDNFTYVLVDAINHLLDTPEVPVPVEVYTDSVMYKYRDDRLENLSSVQKHLLRMGPENMRRIKAKLREIKQSL